MSEVRALTAALVFLACPSAGQPPASNPQQLFQEAVKAQQRGDDADALKKYRELLRIQPGATGIRVNLGATLAHMGRLDEAIEQYRAVLAAEPGNRPVRLNLAFAYKEKGDLRRAVELLEPLHAREPGDPQATMLLGDCYIRMERYRDAVAVLSPLEADRRDDLDLVWMLGSALIRAGRPQEGVERIEKVAGKANSAEAYLLAGETRLTRDEYDVARRDADAALRLNPGLAGVQTLNGMIRQHTGDLNGAETALRQALLADANDFNAHLYLGAVLYFRRDLKEARLHLERALQLRPGAPRARYELALVAKSDGHMDAALGDLEAVSRQNPDWLEPHVELAALYYRLKRPDDGARENQIVDRLMAARQQRGTGPGR